MVCGMMDTAVQFVSYRNLLQFKSFTHLGENSSYFCDLCLNKQSVRSFDENQQLKLELKIKRTRQVLLANRQEAASVSVHERA